jgi:hypothetical protein
MNRSCDFRNSFCWLYPQKYIPINFWEYFKDGKYLVLNQIIIFLIQNIQFCRIGIYFHLKIFRFVSNYYIQILKNIPIILGEYILDSKNIDLYQGIIF